MMTRPDSTEPDDILREREQQRWWAAFQIALIEGCAQHGNDPCDVCYPPDRDDA